MKGVRFLALTILVTGILAGDFSQGMVLHFLLYKKLPLCNFVQVKFLFISVF